MKIDNQLRFRRQFILSSTPSAQFEDWRTFTLFNAQYHLYVHPDLNVHVADSEDKRTQVVMLGYALDPMRPEFDDQSIVDYLSDMDSVDEFAEAVTGLAGRFVLLFHQNDATYVFHDACGLRTVFYSVDQNGTYVGSQPSIFSAFFPLGENENYDTLRQSGILEDLNFWIPCESDIYANVKQLVPNHYLALNDGVQHRYWPVHPLERITLEQAVEQGADLLRRLMNVAHRRFPMALALTAGVDSRTLLAASRDIIDDLYFYTAQYRDLSMTSPDIAIPSDILTKHGLAYHVLDCNVAATPDFLDICRSNIDLPHKDWGEIAYGLALFFPQDRVSVKGNCAEIARSYLYKYGDHPEKASAKDLMQYGTTWDGVAFIEEALDAWLLDAKPAADNAGLYLLDLFYWEQKMGTWQAQSQLEWDIAQEAFTPFNYRPLLECLLSCPPQYRIADDYVLFREIIKRLWPELLDWPFNPHVKSSRLKHWVKKELHRVGLQDSFVFKWLKRVYHAGLR